MEQTSERAVGATPIEGTCPVCPSARLVRMDYPSTTEQWRDLEVVVCKSCGFGHVPNVTFDLAAYYASSYGESHGRRNLKPGFFKEIDQVETKKVKRSRGHAQMLHDRFGAFGSVLDIGSGPGFFLHYVKAERKFAIESDRRSQDMLKSLGATVVGSLDEVDDLDLIVMSHVLEHFLVDDYRAYLKTAMSRLKPGGVLMIEVPEWPHLDERSQRPNGKGHEPHTMFFSKTGLLDAVDGELLYFHHADGAFRIADGKVDWDSPVRKPKFPSAMLAMWRRP